VRPQRIREVLGRQADSQQSVHICGRSIRGRGHIKVADWFTASTCFANPAVTFVRALTDTFAGIRAGDVPGFVAAQFAGAMAATFLFRWLVPSPPETAERVAVPRSESAAR